MKTRKLVLCGLAMLGLIQNVWPCINKSGTKYGGDSGPYSGWRSLEAALKKNLPTDGVEMEAQLRGSTNYNDRSDYAVALMFLGRGREAVALLEELERQVPGHFFIAANLGTAYELAGDNAAALRWISEGIRRNPQDHEGTEWLHVKILEAKLAQEKDAAYFEKHSVLELRPAEIARTVSIGREKLSPQELAKAIVHQLAERLQFVKPPDAAVASLLFDYAAIEAAIGSMESAKHVLRLAEQYGYPATKVKLQSAALDRRLALMHFKTYSTYTAIGVLIIALIALLYRRGVIRRSR
jgi:tetratricopeptide (TPR) repeat protein